MRPKSKWSCFNIFNFFRQISKGLKVCSISWKLRWFREKFGCKVEKILKGSLNSIPSPSSSVKIQIMCGKVCLRCKGKILLGVVNILLKTKRVLTSPSNVLPLHLKQTFPPIIWIFTEGKGDGIGPRLPFKIFSTLSSQVLNWFSLF